MSDADVPTPASSRALKNAIAAKAPRAASTTTARTRPSRFIAPPRLARSADDDQPSTSRIKSLNTRYTSVDPERTAMDLTDPSAFARVYDEHSPGVYRAAYGIVRDATMAQDVTQDVFLRLWRRPRTFDSGRGEIGSYLRLMARSRALDLWREGQAARRGGGRLRPRAASGGGGPGDPPPPGGGGGHPPPPG